MEKHLYGGIMKNWQKRILILSPIAVLTIGQLTIRLFASLWGVWSWLPFWLVYILVLAMLVSMNGGRTRIASWLAPSRARWWWAVIACAVPMAMTLPIFLPNWTLLLSLPVLFSTLLFVAVNPFMEEFYWRGVLLDATHTWPRWLSISYSVLFFTLHHLWIGVIAAAGRHPSALAGPVLMGTVWALTYKSTGNLRLPIIGHILANLFSLSIPVFLNVWTPGIQP